MKAKSPIAEHWHVLDYREIDVRGTYTVISIASLLNMLTPQLTEGVADFLLRYAQLARSRYANSQAYGGCWEIIGVKGTREVSGASQEMRRMEVMHSAPSRP